MNAPITKKPAAPVVEGHFLIPAGYSKFIALPMSLATAVMPHIKYLEKTYDSASSNYTWALDEHTRKSLAIELKTADEMTALLMAARLTEGAG